MDRRGAWNRVDLARVARLATIGSDGRPDLVPVTFALVHADRTADEGRLVIAVDHKPKSTRRLRRLDNIRARADVSVIVDHYDDADWSQLWWVRLDGTARVADDVTTEPIGFAALVAKYAPYAVTPPEGPLIIIEVRTWQWWSAAGGQGPVPRPPPRYTT